jgi:hypothetical protein
MADKTEVDMVLREVDVLLNDSNLSRTEPSWEKLENPPMSDSSAGRMSNFTVGAST